MLNLPALSFSQGAKGATDLFVATFGSQPEGRMASPWARQCYWRTH